MSVPLIPSLDPAGLPGPIWLFHVLLVVTFVLHLVFMNLTLGGTLIAAVSRWRSRGRAEDHRTVLATRLMGVNTFGISLTITTGVAPLLFIQALYQQYFYAATILLGWIWFALLILLVVGYYAAYAYKFEVKPTGAASSVGGAIWLWLSAVLFLGIAVIQVAVNLLHSQPGLWAQAEGNPWLFLADPTFVPRWLHFVFAGTAWSALLIVWWSVRQARRGRDAELNTRIARTGWVWARWATLLQVVDGVVLLLLLPRRVLVGLMGGGVAGLPPVVVAIVTGFVLLVFLVEIRDPVQRPPVAAGLLIGTMGVMTVMSITRHQVRALYLAPARAEFELMSTPQWLPLVLFVVLLLGGGAVLWRMIRRVLESSTSPV